MVDRFAPLNAAERDAVPNAGAAASEWTPVVPAPPDVRLVVPPHRLGHPAMRWAYRDVAGRLLGVTCRFDHAGGGKDVLPLVYCAAPSGRSEWRWHAFPAPRPLYGLERLAARPDAPVLVVEGEKVAEAARRRFPDLVAVTSSGGALAAAATDWFPLRGRCVTVWPDNDPSGSRYATDVARLAHEAGAVSVQVVSVPGTWPRGWDVADPLPAGAGEADLVSMLRNAPDAVEDASERSADTVTLISAASIAPEPIRWLWFGWLALGKLHILAGPAGTGKTSLALRVAATVTTGGRWPDGTSTGPGSVLVWSSEDAASDSLVPRLMACGADRGRVHFISSVSGSNGHRPFDPADDMGHLAEVMLRRPDIKLLILDPIVSAVRGDGHKNAEVRRSLQPVVDLAQRRGVAILGVTHFTKNTAGREPMERVTGSLAFGALARVVLCTTAPAEEGAMRRLVRAKSNISRDGGGFEYGLKQMRIPDHPDVVAQAIEWGRALEGPARVLLAEVETPPAGGEGSALREAERFLRDLLASGPTAASDVRAAALAAGLAWTTICRAKAKLEIHPTKSGMASGWMWSLPCGSDRRNSSIAEDGQLQGLDSFGTLDHLRADDDAEAF